MQATQLSFMSFLLNSFYSALIHYKQFMKYHSLFCELRPVRYFAMIRRLHRKLFPRHQDNKNIYKLLIEIYSLCFFGYFPRMRPVAFSVPGKPSELGAVSVSAAVPLSIVSSSLFRKFMEHCGCIGFKNLSVQNFFAYNYFRFCAASFHHIDFAYFS